MTTKRKYTEEEYNELKRKCKLWGLLFPLPKTYEFYLEFKQYLKDNPQTHGFY